MDITENPVRFIDRRGSVEVITGSMFSGKTEELIRRLRRAQIAGLKVEIFKPSMETRYSETLIVSHDNKSVVSTPVENPSDIILLTGSVDVVGIDEAQIVLVGEKDHYEPLCRSCYNAALKNSM